MDDCCSQGGEKNEEACDKVRARSAVTTEPVEGTTELGNQIAKLMSALTRDEQGNCPASTPNSPRQRGHGRWWMDRNTPGHPSSHNSWTGLDRTPQSVVHLLDVTQGPPLLKARNQIHKGPMKALQIGRTPFPSSASGVKVGATWLRNVAPQQTWNQSRGNWGECSQTPTSTSCNSQW